MGKLKTEIIKDKCGNRFEVESYKLKNGDVLFTTKDSYGNVVNTGKFKSKEMVIKSQKEYLRG